MLSSILKCFVILTVVFHKVNAFWWQPPTTTESPVINVKHIPLTYFRTYTYQPLTGGPFTFPLSFGAQPQTPVLAGTRYEHTYTYPSNGLQLLSQRPNVPLAASTTTAAPTTSSTTTTTTTTTPAPKTTPSTTTTTTTTANLPSQSIINSGGGTFAPFSQYESSIYPTYNRRYYSSNYNGESFYRPHYPYPDYASLTKTASMFGGSQQRPSHVQFVPCMCPVSVGVPSGLPIVSSGSGMNVGSPYLPQARSNSEDDDEPGIELPLDNEESREKSVVDIEPEEQESQNDDDTLMADDQPMVITSNKIDGGYRKSKEIDLSTTDSP